MRSGRFNPRSRTGSDMRNKRQTDIFGEFQSTLPHGERHCCASQKILDHLFQSTLPHGERLSAEYVLKYIRYVSIHAPARGATALSAVVSATTSFQSTLPHGERPAGEAQYGDITEFQSTLPHGERQGFPESYQVKVSFNPRSRTGSDIAPAPPPRRSPGFNPRSRTGSDPRSPQAGK